MKVIIESVKLGVVLTAVIFSACSAEMTVLDQVKLRRAADEAQARSEMAFKARQRAEQNERKTNDTLDAIKTVSSSFPR